MSMLPHFYDLHPIEWHGSGNGERSGKQKPSEVAEQNIILQERLRETKEQLTRVQHQFTSCQEKVHQQEFSTFRLHEQLREKNNYTLDLQRELMRVEQEMREKDEKQNNLQEKLRVKLEELERELRDQVQDNVDLRKDLSAAKESLSKYEPQLKTRDWILPRDKIEITEKCLGKGAYGVVFKGRYCGCDVAIKKLCGDLTLAPIDRDLFEREIDIASRCRHPCLLQFIGATTDESPLLVTELMETSLRRELKKLSETEVSVISLDVACALNYLHQTTPTPIVHRDISDTNVLLWRRNNEWRGKVSDYGTAKFLQTTMTAAIGAMIYRAPEAGDPFKQTVKIDVYSFGVLLCEMCIKELPDPDNRDEQVARVTSKAFRGLILWCLEEDPDMRPSMDKIINDLEKFDGMS